MGRVHLEVIGSSCVSDMLLQMLQLLRAPMKKERFGLLTVNITFCFFLDSLDRVVEVPEVDRVVPVARAVARDRTPNTTRTLMTICTARCMMVAKFMLRSDNDGGDANCNGLMQSSLHRKD